MLASCASRSPLHHLEADGTVEVDAAPEAWNVEASGPECVSRPTACLKDDFGPNKALKLVFDECTGSVGKSCGDMTLVFDAQGCLLTLNEISQYSPAFVACVERVVSGTRWLCAVGKGGTSYHLLDACGP